MICLTCRTQTHVFQKHITGLSRQLKDAMTEILIYLAIAIGSLLMMSYTVHMFVGGLVSTETEYFLIAVTCLGVVGIIGYMTWDVIQKRKGRR